MKRLVSIVCLSLGVSVVSYANAITSATGTSLLGPNAGLVNFESTSFPIGTFSSISNFNIPNTSINATIAFGAASGSGTSGSVQNQYSSFFGNTGKYLTDINYTGGIQPGTAAASQFARTLTITFSAPITEFLLDYFANDSRTAAGGSTVNAALNYYTINGLATQYSLIPQTGSELRQAGYTVAGDTNGVTAINSVTFTIGGFDSAAGLAADVILYDNLRVSTTTGSGPGGGVVPEPSTYALIGAGLAALAYLRRKK